MRGRCPVLSDSLSILLCSATLACRLRTLWEEEEGNADAEKQEEDEEREEGKEVIR